MSNTTSKAYATVIANAAAAPASELTAEQKRILEANPVFTRVTVSKNIGKLAADGWMVIPDNFHNRGELGKALAWAELLTVSVVEEPTTVLTASSKTLYIGFQMMFQDGVLKVNGLTPRFSQDLFTGKNKFIDFITSKPVAWAEQIDKKVKKNMEEIEAELALIRQDIEPETNHRKYPLQRAEMFSAYQMFPAMALPHRKGVVFQTDFFNSGKELEIREAAVRSYRQELWTMNGNPFDTYPKAEKKAE